MDRQHLSRTWCWMFICLSLLLCSCILSVQGQDEDPDTVTFELYTNASDIPERMWPVDSGLSTNTSFNACAKTVLFITGVLQGRDDPNIIAIIQALTQASNYNAILVNYNTFRYVTAVKIAGQQIATFLGHLSEHYNLDPSNIILWGFSLGSHVAGYASSIFRVGRISAVDPAGPIFDILPESLRLDRSDTDFLDAMHFSNVIGTLRDDVGHVNFIFNRGTLQPECFLLDIICNHFVALWFYKDSITSCEFQFRQCSSYSTFMSGLCDLNPTLTFGLALDPATAPRNGEKLYYASDHNGSPYCLESEQTTPQFNATVC